MVFGKEPTLILYSLQGVLQAVAVVALPWSGATNQSIHAVVALLLAAVTGFLNRQVVTPAP